MKRSKRGFAIYTSFNDAYGKRITVVRSSLVGPPHVWIQNEVTEHMGVHLGNAHLNRRMAKQIIKALQAFIDGKE